MLLESFLRIKNSLRRPSSNSESFQHASWFVPRMQEGRREKTLVQRTIRSDRQIYIGFRKSFASLFPSSGRCRYASSVKLNNIYATRVCKQRSAFFLLIPAGGFRGSFITLLFFRGDGPFAGLKCGLSRISRSCGRYSEGAYTPGIKYISLISLHKRSSERYKLLDFHYMREREKINE